MDLNAETFLFLDCQTSGLSAQSAEMLEVGWSFSLGRESVRTALLRPSDLEKISSKVWKITGLSPLDFETAEDPTVLWKRLVEEARQAKVTAAVIHYSSFEMGFFRVLHAKAFPGEQFPWPVVCTYRVAGRVCKDLPARTLRALSGYLGEVLPPTQRSLDHVAATQKVWQFLVQKLASEKSIQSWEAFRLWWETPVSKSVRDPRSQRSYQVSSETRKGLPMGPGVYEMRSASGTLLYIGKATCLRTRVASYFRYKPGDRHRLPELMTQVSDIQVIETATAVEAALLETDRIKEFEPHYNTALRKNDRRVRFFSWDLQTSATESSEDFPLGPFLYDEVFESVGILLRLLKGSTNALDVQMLSHPVEVVKPELESVLVELGVSDSEALTLYRLHRLGKKLLPASEREEVETEEELTPEQEREAVRDSILRKLRRPSPRIHRTRWMAWLQDCRVLWRMGKQASDPWRFLVFSAGQIVERGTVTNPESLGVYRRARRLAAQRRKAFSVTNYDRLRVLVTELGILAKTVPVTIEFSASRRFSNQDGTRSWLSRVLPQEEQ